MTFRSKSRWQKWQILAHESYEARKPSCLCLRICIRDASVVEIYCYWFFLSFRCWKGLSIIHLPLKSKCCGTRVGIALAKSKKSLVSSNTKVKAAKSQCTSAFSDFWNITPTRCIHEKSKGSNYFAKCKTCWTNTHHCIDGNFRIPLYASFYAWKSLHPTTASILSITKM